MKEMIFKGVATALVTPALENGAPDLEAYSRLIEWQIASGINALVVCGTTGEPATMSGEEYESTVKTAIRTVNKRIPVIVGTGSNSTSAAIERSLLVKEWGADAILVVTPYYNKCTQDGLVAHYKAISDSVDLPMIVYNVPGRTGVNIQPKTYLKLSEIENVRGIKEASGNVSAIAEIENLVGDKVAVYSGNDDQIVPILSLGGYGVISVLSNVLPKETCHMVEAFFENKVKESRDLQIQLIPLISALFSEVNPIPAKAALSKMGYGENVLRLPLTSMTEEKANVLYELMKENGVKI